MSALKESMDDDPADWRQAARAFFDARGFAPGSPFRAIADALADGFAESEGPLQIPLALALFGKAEVLTLFAERSGPLSFADLRRVVAVVAVEFPQVTAEYVRVTLNMLGQGGLLESAYRKIDPATGAATDLSAVEWIALLRRAQAPGPDGVAASERLARITLDWRAVFPLQENCGQGNTQLLEQRGQLSGRCRRGRGDGGTIVAAHELAAAGVDVAANVSSTTGIDGVTGDEGGTADVAADHYAPLAGGLHSRPHGHRTTAGHGRRLVVPQRPGGGRGGDGRRGGRRGPWR